jgi:hypothetical protein
VKYFPRILAQKEEIAPGSGMTETAPLDHAGRGDIP